jgi:hypothetical protein
MSLKHYTARPSDIPPSAEDEFGEARAEIERLRAAARKQQQRLLAELALKHDRQRQLAELTAKHEKALRERDWFATETARTVGLVQVLERKNDEAGIALSLVQTALAESQAASEVARAASEAALAKSQAAVADAVEDLLKLRSELMAVRAQHEALLNSTIWKMTYPLRAGAERMPPGPRHIVRRGVKLVWWTATLQIVEKLRLWRSARRRVNRG